MTSRGWIPRPATRQAGARAPTVRSWFWRCRARPCSPAASSPRLAASRATTLPRWTTGPASPRPGIPPPTATYARWRSLVRPCTSAGTSPRSVAWYATTSRPWMPRPAARPAGTRTPMALCTRWRCRARPSTSAVLHVDRRSALAPEITALESWAPVGPRRGTRAATRLLPVRARSARRTSVCSRWRCQARPCTPAVTSPRSAVSRATIWRPSTQRLALRPPGIRASRAPTATTTIRSSTPCGRRLHDLCRRAIHLDRRPAPRQPGCAGRPHREGDRLEPQPGRQRARIGDHRRRRIRRRLILLDRRSRSPAHRGAGRDHGCSDDVAGRRQGRCRGAGDVGLHGLRRRRLQLHRRPHPSWSRLARRENRTSNRLESQRRRQHRNAGTLGRECLRRRQLRFESVDITKKASRSSH